MTSYERMQNSRTRRKQDIVKVMGGKCALCGYNKTINALECHHINPEEKEYSFNKAINRNWTLIQSELKKCILLCANCHREVHAGLVQQTLISSFNLEEAEKISEHIIELQTHKAHYCPSCGAIISADARQCIECSLISKRITAWPTRNELKDLIRTISFVEIAKRYSVTDNAVRKWCDKYNLPRKKCDIKNLSNKEWEQI